MININFLAGHRSLKSKQKEQDKKLFKISTFVIGAVLFLTIAAFAGKFFINLRIKQAGEDIAHYRTTILNQENTELNYLIFVNKLSAISEIYKKRSDKQEAMNYFSEICRDSAEVVGMGYEEEEGGLVLQLSNADVFKLEQTMNTLDSDEVRSKYPNIQKSVLNRGDLGEYKLTLQLELKANK